MSTPYVAISLAAPSVSVALVAAYALVLLAVAWGFDLMSQRVAKRSNAWRTGNFTYHEDHDAWLCPEDEWLWPKSFDPENRVMRYRAKPSVCNGCVVKATCTDSDQGREVTREYDPWPYSEAGKFHRGISVMVAVVALVLPLGMFIGGTHSLTDVLVLLGTIIVVLAASYPLAKHLWQTPSGFPENVSQDHVYQPVVRDRYQTTWGTKGKV